MLKTKSLLTITSLFVSITTVIKRTLTVTMLLGTKTKRKQLVKLVIHAYQHYDLLDCKKASEQQEENQSQAVLIEGLLNGPRKVLEYTMTFVNALASECLGRSYLL